MHTSEKIGSENRCRVCAIARVLLLHERYTGTAVHPVPGHSRTSGSAGSMTSTSPVFCFCFVLFCFDSFCFIVLSFNVFQVAGVRTLCLSCPGRWHDIVAFSCRLASTALRSVRLVSSYDSFMYRLVLIFPIVDYLTLDFRCCKWRRTRLTSSRPYTVGGQQYMT